MADLTKHGRIMVVTQNYYGVGETVEKALAAAKKEGWRGTGPVLTYEFPKEVTDAGVYGIGNVEWSWEPEGPAPTQPVIVKEYTSAKQAKAGKHKSVREIPPAN